MDIKTQAKKYGYNLVQGTTYGIEPIFKKHSIWAPILFVVLGFFQLASRPNPIFGIISIVCGIALLVIGSIENKKFDVRNLDIKRIAVGKQKLAVESKNGSVQRFAANEVDRIDISYRRGAADSQVGTMSVIDQEGNAKKILVIVDKDQKKMEWVLNGIAESIAEKLNEEEVVSSNDSKDV